MKKAKNILTVAVFALILVGFGLWHMILPDADVSISERRDLAQAPALTAKTLFNREFSDKLETYLVDQFPLRESFRSLNASFRFSFLRQLDSNGYWTRDGVIYKTEKTTDEAQIKYAARLYNSLISSELSDCNVYFTVIPDKSYYADDTVHPRLDYTRLIEIMKANVQGAEYIDILDTLSIDKYYRTDTHWRQQDLFDTVERLASAMGVDEYLTPASDYTPHELSPFYGVYLRQAAMPVEPETLTYLTGSYTDNALVSGPEYKSSGVYATEKFDGMDGYDVFLSGTQAIIEIECPDARTDRHLYLFRDSFGSSLAPLLTGAYAKITVIDLRYVTSAYLPTIVDFAPGSDVLFANSTLVLNTAMIMR